MSRQQLGELWQVLSQPQLVFVRIGSFRLGQRLIESHKKRDDFRIGGQSVDARSSRLPRSTTGPFQIEQRLLRSGF